jgi:regulator of cell morphogenesis and NO signaling
MKRKDNMAIQIDGQTTVRELVGRYPQTRPVFESQGIDYCCGGAQALADVARQHGVELAVLVAALEHVLQTPSNPQAATDRDWYAAPLGELVDHIVTLHHRYMHAALPRLRMLTQKVLNAHGLHHGDVLRQVQALYGALDAELSSHLTKEEQILFPYVVALEAHARDGAEQPAACFGSVRSPIQQMEHEHENAGGLLVKLREVTGNYALPQDACLTFAAFYEGLQEMEADLHQHIHLENNILFPRAIACED